jgi:UBX domain-containing protein 1/4
LAKIDEYIGKISSYRAGGDGGKCLKILKVYVTNIVDNPHEEKFRSINTDNKVYKTKVKPFLGAKSLLLAVGFEQAESGEALVLNPDADVQVLSDIKSKLEAAMIAYG